MTILGIPLKSMQVQNDQVPLAVLTKAHILEMQNNQKENFEEEKHKKKVEVVRLAK